ncbi:hypothetical protein QWY85_11320 [Neolewinella lacunae]|uniref:Uncharacterized protein n=1 Tax=Neolewinella lacunae TaxID=1517758 RepID=A0A923T8A8_9BACT|nr:hypothetical protein [Neolewinella lacunae]MBC6993748.1 hypothetical protein [Neolewinella lacunae]MDN3635251.1 hypothetical protein [Neolewinella lacunae]
MSFKSIFLSLTFVMASAVSFAGHEVEVAPQPVAITTTVACTLTGSFSTGGTTVNVSVTAETCGAAARTLASIADALDQQ